MSRPAFSEASQTGNRNSKAGSFAGGLRAVGSTSSLLQAKILPRAGNRYAGLVVALHGHWFPDRRSEIGGGLQNPVREAGRPSYAHPIQRAGDEQLRQDIGGVVSGRRQHTPITLLRLFYAVELRYGVLADIARKVHAGEPVALGNGAFNCIWQRDANELILRALPLAASPASVYNLCRPEIFSVREIATQLGEELGRAPIFSGNESSGTALPACHAPDRTAVSSGRQTATALLGNSAKLTAALGPPATPMATILRCTAQWVQQGGRDLARPTHFEEIGRAHV